MSEFDFEAWVTEAQQGLAHLKQRERNLKEERDEIEEQLVQCGEEISALENMLSAADSLPKPKPSTPIKRVYGVKKEAKLLAETLAIGVEWKEEQLVQMVAEKVPGARLRSIVRALSELAAEGIFTRSGQRSDWTYRTTIGVTPVDATPTPAPLPLHRPKSEPTPDPDPAPEPEVDPEVTAKFPRANDPTDGYAEKPNEAEVQQLRDVKKTMDAIEKEMKKRKQFNISDSTIGQIAKELGVTNGTVREALKILVKGKYEVDYDGEAKVLRHRRTERDRLKEAKVQDRPLFPSADRPEHA